MYTRAVLIGAAMLALGVSQLAAQTVGPEAVQALRQLAIDAGQTSRSADKPAAMSPAAIEFERQAIEAHRAEFIARAYARTASAEAGPRDVAGKPAGSVLLIPSEATQGVDRDTVLAVRQLAIAAGQTSSSADSPPVRSQEEIELERTAIDSHRAEFFTRAYGDKPGV